MNRRFWQPAAFVLAFAAFSGSPARAQWGFPGGFGGFGWEGWGVGTVAGDEARGLGMFAAGLGTYNLQTAQADSIDADTVMKWNEYLYQSQRSADVRRRERADRRLARNTEQAEANLARLRDNPTTADIVSGDALNTALSEINDPRIYVKALEGAKAKIGGDKIRIIPFRYNAAAITVSVHQIATGDVPAGLRRPEFAADLQALKSLDEQIIRQVEADQEPDPATVKKLLGAIYAAEEKAVQVLPANSLELKQAQKHLKALHGLVAMIKTPSLDTYLAGVENRPEASLGELIQFMNAFNLRFGAATTPRQREVYTALYPSLDALRDQIAPALAAAAPRRTLGGAVQDFFSWMSFGDLGKSAPKP